MNDFILENTDVPPARKENPSLFRPPSASQTLRQAIYAQLKAHPEEMVSISRICIALAGSPYGKVYSACKQLVKSGFATREVKKVHKPTEENPERMVDYIAVKYVQPWEGKKQSKW